MPYNWKCCSFYPNNFGASALMEERGIMWTLNEMYPRKFANLQKKFVVF